MTPDVSAPSHEKRSDSPSGLATLSEEVSRLGRTIAALRGSEEAVKQEFRSLAARLGKLERESRARSDPDGRQSWQARPAPVNPGNPTDLEIRIHILNQLYQRDCWNGKHTSGIYLGRGYLAKVEWRRIEAAIKGLRSEGILLAHGKSPDEHFSLNPGQSTQVYRMLEFPGRERVPAQRARPGRDDSSAPYGAQDDDASAEFVEVGRFENSMRSIRSALDQDGRALSRLSESLEQHLRAFSEAGARLEARLSQLECRLEGLVHQTPPPPTRPPDQQPRIDRGVDALEGCGR